MSYKQAILRDNPLSFWPLDGGTTYRTYATLLLEYTTYQDYLNNESTYQQEVGSISIQDVSNFGNHGAFTLGAPNFQDVMTLITHSNYDTNLSGCKITPNIGIDVLNLYGAFQQGYEQKTFGTELWVLMPETPIGVCNIMDLHYGSSKRMQIYTDSDFIYFTLWFQGGYSISTKKQVHSWDKPIHIFAGVKDKVMGLYVNGITDESKTIPSNYLYYSDPYSRFAVGPASTNMYFTANGWAMYDRILSVNEIRNHMHWAHRDTSPINYSNQTNVSHFSFDTKSGNNIFVKEFNNGAAFNEGTYSGLVSDKTGITLPQTSSPAPATGTWIYPITISSYTDFAGIELSWNSSSYNHLSPNSLISNKSVIVSVSYDNGLTYYNVTNGKNFPYFLSNFSSSFAGQCLIKVTIHSVDTSTGLQPRLDNLKIHIYSDISEISDSGLFEISPASSTTYMLKKDSTNILSRSRNLGIRFSAQDIEKKPGYAQIVPITGSSYQVIEFWMEYDGSGSAILDTDSSGTADLYIDNSNILQNTVLSSVLYVNGVNRTTSPITISNGEVYHVVLVYPVPISNTILLNGSYDITKTPAEATYGYISIYPKMLTLAQVQARYLSFISVGTGIGTDSITYSGNSLVFTGSSISSFGQLLEYNGTSSQINNGQAIIFHTHI